MTTRHILLTGFEPFDGDRVNPSGEVAKRLDGRVIGDCVVRSTILPVQHEAALAALTAEGIPAAISNTAGTYLCNDISYTTLHALARRGLTIPAGFIHLPFLPSMVSEHNLEEPSMDLPLMLGAIEIALPRTGG